MQENNQYGSLYVIKYGKVVEIPNIQSADEVRSGKRMPSEIELIAYSLDISEEEAEKLDYSQDSVAFQALLDNGYSIIRTFRSNDDDEINNVILGNTISSADYNLIVGIEGEIADNKISDDSNTNIYNRTVNEYGVETEYVDQCHQMRSGRTNASYSNDEMMMIMGLLMEEKLNKLDNAEKEILKRYRSFDFERILTEDNSSDIINNGNAGVILITPDQQVGSTCKSMVHIEQAKTLLKSLYAKEYDSQTSMGKTIVDMGLDGCEQYKTVFFQIMNMNKDAYSLVYLPDKINEFQFQSTKDLLNRILELKGKHSKNFPTYIMHEALDSEESGLLSTPEEILEFLEKRHDRLVDDSIQGLEYSKPKEPKPMSYKKVCEITGSDLKLADGIRKDIIESTERKGKTKHEIEMAGKLLSGTEKVVEL